MDDLSPDLSPSLGRGDKKQNRSQLVSLAFELGFIIALPILAFGYAGKWLDGKFGTTPVFTLLGTLLAIISTTVWIYRKFKSYF